MKSSFFILLFTSCLLSSSLFASGSRVVRLDFGAGFSLINSKGLNKVTEGFDSGYGTDFGRIRLPVLLSYSLMFGKNSFRLGIESAYEFARRSSSTEIYDFDAQNINLSALPIGAKLEFDVYSRKNLFINLSFSTGLIQLRLNTSTRPGITSDDSFFRSKALSWYFTGGLGSTYWMSDRLGISADILMRYTGNPKLAYSDDDYLHEKGDEVRFSDGSNLTINLIGLQFLVGLVLNWSF